MGIVRGKEGSNMKKCKHCPMKKHCKDECYGENPCAFALTFDNLARRIDLKTVCIQSLRADLQKMNDKIANIDAAPVVHARWEDDHMDSKCSACGTAFHDDMFWIQGYCIAPKYCPNCGALMDAEEVTTNE